MELELERVWAAATARFVLGEGSIHGPAHWRRVERHAVVLAEASGGDQIVARLFAVFHDVCRVSDGLDAEHGARGAALAAAWRDHYFTLTDAQFVLLSVACTEHTAGLLSPDPTIGACWDADRLDLWRAGIITQERFLSTAHARALARAGKIGLGFTP